VELLAQAAARSGTPGASSSRPPPLAMAEASNGHLLAPSPLGALPLGMAGSRCMLYFVQV
jgi:hypothetical protein